MISLRCRMTVTWTSCRLSRKTLIRHPNQTSALIAAWARMYRTNGFDIKLVSLNTPTDTRAASSTIFRKKKSRRIKCRYMTIFFCAKWKHSLKMCRRRAPTVSIIFCYLQNLRMIISTHYLVSARPLIYNDLARKMSLPAKLAVLEKLNNKSQTIQVQNATKVNITYPEKMTDVQIRQKIEKARL